MTVNCIQTPPTKPTCSTNNSSQSSHLKHHLNSVNSQEWQFRTLWMMAYFTHPKLKLHHRDYGIRGPSLKWIQAFLFRRTQTFVLENEKSDTVYVTSGVPKGSVLGPILFLIYINDLSDRTRSKVRLFTDEAIYLAVYKFQNAQILQQDLDRLHESELQWDMEFNPSKCVVIHVTRARTPIANEYLLLGQFLESVGGSK